MTRKKNNSMKKGKIILICKPGNAGMELDFIRKSSSSKEGTMI